MRAIFNLGVRAYFTYTNLFIDSFAATFGVDPAELALHIILPIGIGLFTFEDIASAVKVYRGSCMRCAIRSISAALATWPDLGFVASHWGVWLIPLGTLAFCLIDRKRLVRDWLTQRASLPVAVAEGAASLYFLEIFARIDAQVPFVYFQF